MVKTLQSRYVALIITTILAVIFNLLAIGVVCFGVIPAINKSTVASERSASEVEKSRALIEENHRHLEEHGKTIKRLNGLLDIAEARMKEDDAKKKKEPPGK